MQGPASLPKPTQTESPRHHKTKQRENRWKRKTIWPLQGPTCLPLHCEVSLLDPGLPGNRFPALHSTALPLWESQAAAGRAWREGSSFVLMYLFLLINKNVSLIINEMLWSTHSEGCTELLHSITSRQWKGRKGMQVQLAPAGGKLNWSSHYEKQYGGSSNN